MSRRDADHGKPRKGTLKPYPVWVCHDCALAAGWVPQGNNCSTQHVGTCDVCGHLRCVMEPRDYGYPVFKGFEKP